MKEKIFIDWNYSGKTSLATGTGADFYEKLLGWLSCFVVPTFILYMFLTKQTSWSLWQTTLALFLAFDVGGGMVCNSLNSCKRFYHSPAKDEETIVVRLMKNHLVFSAFHIHPLIVGIFFTDFNWFYGALWYCVFMAAVFIVYKVPLYLKRPVSMMLILLAFMLNFYIILPVKGFEWLIPLLFLKIVYGHMVREEPYRKE